MIKKLLIGLGIAIAILLVVALALPFLIDANRFKPMLESDLSSALGRKVRIGDIQMSVFSGGVVVDSFSVADDPAFNASDFLTTKKLSAGVALFPLIFSKKLEVHSFRIEDPRVVLLRSPDGRWNFSSLGAGAAKHPSAAPGRSGTDSSTAGDITVEKFEISNGTMVVGTSGARGKTETYQNVNLDASNLSFTSPFPFQLTAQTPGGGTISLDGHAGPVDSSDASLTPFSAKLNAEHVDLASTGFVDPSAGLAGALSFNGDISSDGRQMRSQGTVTTEKIRMVAGGSPSDVPVNLDYQTAYDLRREAGSLTQGNVHIGKALAHLTGTYDASGPAITVRMQLAGQAMPVPDLEGVLPAAGIALPRGASLSSGTLDLNLALSGPLDSLVITGPVNLSNGRLAGFSLQSKLGALSSFMGLGSGGSDTVIQTLSADLRVDSAGTHADNLNLVVPAIGAITGNGLISPGGKLDCNMLAKLTATGGAVGAISSALSSFTGGGKSAGGVPFKIQGTTSDPVFVPNVGAIARGMLGNSRGSNTGGAGGILGGLLGRKKLP